MLQASRTSSSRAKPWVGQYSPPPRTAMPAGSFPPWMDLQQGIYREAFVLVVFVSGFGCRLLGRPSAYQVS